MLFARVGRHAAKRNQQYNANFVVCHFTAVSKDSLPTGTKYRLLFEHRSESEFLSTMQLYLLSRNKLF
jgi:hypothetical protein